MAAVWGTMALLVEWGARCCYEQLPSAVSRAAPATRGDTHPRHWQWSPHPAPTPVSCPWGDLTSPHLLPADSSRGAWAGVSGQRVPCPLHSPYQNQLESRLEQVQTFDPFNEASVLYTAFTDGGKALSSHVRGESTTHQPQGMATRELVSGNSGTVQSERFAGQGRPGALAGGCSQSGLGFAVR